MKRSDLFLPYKNKYQPESDNEKNKLKHESL